MVIWQPVRLALRQIDGQCQFDGTMRHRIQDADATRLDSATNRIRAIGNQPARAASAAQDHLIIRNQSGTECHHFNGKRGFACTGLPKDQQSAPLPGHTAGMQEQFRIFNHQACLFSVSYG